MRLEGRHLVAALLLAAVTGTYACGAKNSPTAPTSWPAPDPVSITVLGFPTMIVPPGNPTTVQGIALGRRLYYDPILSADSTQACASCHQYGRSFSDTRDFSVGIDGIEGPRNAPALINTGWLPRRMRRSR
jgi:cytochrome c peroxidase